MTADDPVTADDTVTVGDTVTAAATAPVITVTRGRPDSGELAAVVAVLLAAKAGAAQAGGGQRTSVPSYGWSGLSRLMGTPPRPGPGAWVASARPR